MAIKKIGNILLPVFTVLIIIGVSFAVIAYGRGYRLDFQNKSVGTTGMIAATSDPTGAQIFIDGEKKDVTNANIGLSPGWYTVTIVKNGYQPWEKHVRVQGEVLTRVDPVLFSSNPSLYALTSTGVLNPTRSPDGTKLAYGVPEATDAGQLASRAGIWVLDLLDKPLGMNRDARQIVKREHLNTDEAILTWSPDSKQILVTTTANDAYLLESDRLTENPKFISDIQTLQQDWDDLKKVKDKEKLVTLKEDLRNIATSSMSIISFSPDESKILYEATHSMTLPTIIDPPLIGTNPTEEVRDIQPGYIYVYDIKEDRNYTVEVTKNLNTSSDQQNTSVEIGNSGANTPVQWLPTSNHLLVTGKNKVEIMDFDGVNRKTVYAGPFWDGFVVPWSNAGRIVILTNLNPGAQAISNLYAVNIR